MSINVKKYTKDQMAKMVEDAQEKTAALEAEIVKLKNCIDEKNDLIAEYANLKAAMKQKNVILTERIDQMNGETINKANEIANLKAVLRRVNVEVSRLQVGCRQVEEERDYTHQKWSNAEQRANYAEAHPWRSLWAWAKRKLGCAE